MVKNRNPHKVFEQALNYDKNKCVFCSPIDGSILDDTKNFRILLDNFPITPGHILISSKLHYSSAGELPIELNEELLRIKENLKKTNLLQSKQCIFYEHGRIGSCSSGETKCEHFHLHCVPINLCIHDALRKNFNFTKMLNYKQLTNLFFENGGYLFFENVLGEMYFYTQKNDLEIPSHFLRSLICNGIQRSELSNWEEYCYVDILVKSHSLLNIYRNTFRKLFHQ